MFIKLKKTSLILLLVTVLVSALMLAGCGGESGAEARVKEDLESMRSVELDQDTASEIESLMNNEGKEYYQKFLKMAGDFDYEISQTEKKDGAAVVTVKIRTYDFGSEYLKTWADFLEASETSGDGSGYDTAKLYEMLFQNLSSLQKKEYTGYVDIKCTQGSDGKWSSDATADPGVRNAVFGGMLYEINSLAGED